MVRMSKGLRVEAGRDVGFGCGEGRKFAEDEGSHQKKALPEEYAGHTPWRAKPPNPKPYTP